MGSQMRTFTVPEALLTEIVNYLARRPWSEVNGMMAKIPACEAVEAEAGGSGPFPAPVEDEVLDDKGDPTSGEGNGIT